MADEDLARLYADLGGRLRRSEPLSRHTSFRIGGPADYFVEAESAADICTAQRLAELLHVPLFLLGGGTNVLVSDHGIRGVVLHLGRSFATLDWQTGADATHVRAGAALTFKKLVTEAVRRDLSGLEFAEGIPGSIGGGLLMNAGAFGGEISNAVEYVDGVDATGREVRFPREQLTFRYRHFERPAGLIVCGVGFRLTPGDPQAIRTACSDAKRKRESRQPAGFPNAGSVFKNPPQGFAGKWIESVGLKGHRIGDAMISDRHANFIVNLGGARASDVYELMRLAQVRVREAGGPDLEAEVKLVGEWREP